MVEDEKVLERKTVRELGKLHKKQSRGKRNKAVSWKGDGGYMVQKPEDEQGRD